MTHTPSASSRQNSSATTAIAPGGTATPGQIPTALPFQSPPSNAEPVVRHAGRSGAAASTSSESAKPS